MYWHELQREYPVLVLVIGGLIALAVASLVVVAAMFVLSDGQPVVLLSPATPG